MNKQELFKELHYAFTGNRKEKDTWVEKYEVLPPEEAYVAAKAYLESAIRGQDNCQSDWAYWGYEGDITKATVLMNVFDAIRKGVTEFPQPEDQEGNFLESKCSYFQGWSANLVSHLS